MFYKICLRLNLKLLTIMSFWQFIIFNEKTHLFSFIKTFYISTHFWKHYTQSLSFIIIILVTNKVFVTLFTKRNIDIQQKEIFQNTIFFFYNTFFHIFVVFVYLLQTYSCIFFFQFSLFCLFLPQKDFWNYFDSNC